MMEGGWRGEHALLLPPVSRLQIFLPQQQIGERGIVPHNSFLGREESVCTGDHHLSVGVFLCALPLLALGRLSPISFFLAVSLTDVGVSRGEGGGGKGEPCHPRNRQKKSA